MIAEQQCRASTAYQEFDENGRIKLSAYYDRLVDVMEELAKFTLIVRHRSDYLTSRSSEGAEGVPELAATVVATAMSHETNLDETKDDLE